MTRTDDPPATSQARASLATVIPLPPALLVPLPAESSEHLPIGTRVARGQTLITSTTGTAFIPLAPADGTITAVRHAQLLDATAALALELTVAENDRSPTPAPAPPPADLTEMIERLRGAGVWANRHTCPDLLAQLHEIIRRPIDTLVCNMLDVDGGSSLHARLVRESGATLLNGVSALAKATGAGRVWLAVSPRLADRVNVLLRKSQSAGTMRVVPLVNDYPQANPTLLLYALLGRRLRPEKLPPEVGAMVIDGAAGLAVGHALESGEPMLTVPIEVRDSARAQSHVATAAVGTPLRHILSALQLTEQYTLRSGAALRDLRITSEAIVAGTELSVDAGAVSPPINPDPCIRCGWCVEACPVRIHPAGLLDAAQENDLPLAERYGLHACIECGICSYVCPSRLPLLGAIRQMREVRG